MRILIVGAGATGGAFGSRLIEAGRDVTFLVRPARAAVLRRDGLRFTDPEGTRTLDIAVLTADELAAAPQDFDLVILTVKAPALDAAIADLRPAVGEGTIVLPILNGMAHLGRLEAAFGPRVLGALAMIVATLDDGAVVQMTDWSALTIGDGAPDVARALDVPGIRLAVSDDVTGALWAKWAFIAATGILCCLFRSPVGPVIAAGGGPHVRAIIAETEAVAAAAGHPVPAESHERTAATLLDPESAMTSSLYRDLLAGLPNEAGHILGDLAARARELGVATPLLDLTLVQVRADAVQRG
ncbi:2-dehydropantoate 2-reductase [Tsukamurella ocularis]|uniref:2-dehydropantoate 2-reductase n=1 Tax=Tsukamurella ocularis TaxID=1970234 RepID=UPI0021696833|nr:2-dehydropantoate 2-reductase [Tsukamurella ocularis]MCS3778989.1 2-dehydropantoate 2-reductase [Tsukamurella ocularis]MCS3787391.1 2-dehydropantoate 2-reductase [Tsukamurella ocularis]MCS3851672.1 2-dehydropantoate 2-reductase [Tsukamurella ocularis]